MSVGLDEMVDAKLDSLESMMHLSKPGTHSPVARDAWLIALQHIAPIRAAIARAREAEKGTP